MLFESFGLRYIGPVDGHNVADLVTALQNAKEQDVPVLIHAHTVKGKGYEPAEEDPITWHAVVPFDRDKGKFIPAQVPPKKTPSYTGVFADTMIKLADRDPKIRAITAAMATGTGLNKFEEVHADKFYDVAICEQHAVTFAAGLACEGLKPVCAIYSTFLQRAYDQVVHDVCLQNLPVVFAMDRAGVVGADGHTHQGVFDIAYLRCLPNIVVMAPKDENEFQHMLYTAVNHNAPSAIRYPRGNGTGVEMDQDFKTVPIGKGEMLRRGEDALIVAFGPQVNLALEIADKLAKEVGIEIAVLNARFAKPLDQELLSKELPKYPVICCVEDHALMGGFGSALLEFVNDSGIELRSSIKRFGVQDQFVAHGSQKEQFEMNGYGAKDIYDYLKKRVSPRRAVVNQ